MSLHPRAQPKNHNAGDASIGVGEDQLAEEKSARSRSRSSRSREEEVKLDPEAQFEQEVGRKELGELHTHEERVAWKRIKREENRRNMIREVEEEKKVDALLAEKNIEREDIEQELPVAKGPGTWDTVIAAIEFGLGFIIIMLSIAGFFISTDTYSLNPCGSVQTATGVPYCIINVKSVFVGNSTVNSTTFQACRGVDYPGCCSSPMDLAKREADRQGCVEDLNTGALVCLDSTEFEDQCRDKTSCPQDVVDSFIVALCLFSSVLLIIGIVSLIRGWGVYSVSGIHYLDIYNHPKSDRFFCAFLSAAKRGTAWKQYLLCILFVPSAFWLLYNGQRNFLPRCSEAESMDGGRYELPYFAYVYYVVTLCFMSAALICTTYWRFVLEVRPEIFDPQISGSEICTCCGFRVDCKGCRSEDACESSKWCGYRCYSKTRSLLLLSCGKCGNCRPGLCCWSVTWAIIFGSNLLHLVTITLLGLFLEMFARYAHWIGV